MGNITQLIPVAELAEVARAFVREEDHEINQYSLAPFFPSTLTPLTEIDFWVEQTENFTATTPFRAFDVGPDVGSRPGVVQKAVGLPALSREYPTPESEVLARRAAQRGATIDQIFEDVVYADVERGIRSARNRMELAMAEWIVNGTLTISENGVQQTANAGRDPLREASAAIVWSTSATATPGVDEDAALLVMRQKENLGVGDLVVLANRATFDEWKNTAEVIASYESNRLLGRISDDQANVVRREHGYPDVVIVEKELQNVAGTLVPLIPDGKWIYMPRRAVGEGVWGTPAIVESDDVNIAANESPGPVAYIEEQTKPFVRSTVIEAIGLPVFTNPDSTYVLTV
jgi:hypothetical protein